MKKYLTISEFAKLRNLNISSIRYYEKQGVLQPAWVDPQTKYRYYLPEQLPVLDTISLCIKLGLPLQEAKQYISPDGQVDCKSLFQQGRQLMKEKISDMEAGLEIAEYNLRVMESNAQYRYKEGTYIREIEERFVLAQPFIGDWSDLVQKEQSAIDLFTEAQEQKLVPVFPVGILVHCDTTPASFSFFVQVLRPPQPDGRIVHIPAAQFSCIHADLTPQTDILALLAQHFPDTAQQTAIISSMPLSEFRFSSRYAEIQILRQNL